MKVNPYWNTFKPIDQYWHYFIGIVYFVITFVALITNLMAFFYQIKAKKNSNNPSKLFVYNLIIADLFKVVLCLPMNFISSYFGQWVFDQWGCDFYGVAGGVFGFLSISTLMFMSIERFLVIRNPFFSLKLTKNVVLCFISITWIYSTIWIIPQLFTENRFVLEGFLTSCTFDYLSQNFTTRILIILMFIGGFLVPLLTISIAYSQIFFLLKSRTFFHNIGSMKATTSSDITTAYKTSSVKSRIDRNSIREQNNLIKKPIDSLSLKNKFSNGKRNRPIFSERDLKITKSIIINVLMFCVSWMPYAIIALLAQFGSHREYFVNPYSTSLPAIFAKLSSIFNPIVHTLTNKDCINFYKNLLQSSKGLNENFIPVQKT